MGFQKTRSLLSNLLRRGQRQQSAIIAEVPGGSEKRKSSNDGEPAHGQEKRRPSTYVEGKKRPDSHAVKSTRDVFFFCSLVPSRDACYSNPDNKKQAKMTCFYEKAQHLKKCQ